MLILYGKVVGMLGVFLRKGLDGELGVGNMFLFVMIVGFGGLLPSSIFHRV